MSVTALKVPMIGAESIDMANGATGSKELNAPAFISLRKEALER